MHDVHEFLKSLTIVLVVAAVTTVLFQRLRQPVVLGYIIAGLIVGPHVPIPLVADPGIVHTLSELGVILLMFFLGLEFSLAKLVRVGPTAGVTAVIQTGLMAWLGFLVGRLFGWTPIESIFAGAIVAISSTTIIAKVFDEYKIGGRLREFVVGVLLFEDLIAIVFMAILTAVATGAGLSTGALTSTVGRLVMFLIILLGVGILVIPRFIRLVTRLGRAETTLVASVGVCFATAYVAQAAGYSVALGAFLAGSLVAESGHAEEIENLVRPLRDVFAAIFFVSVGILIDPVLVVEHWGAVVALTLVVIVGKLVGVSLGAFLVGTGSRTAVQAGLSLAQIGEFSFIIASLGLSLGATRAFLYPVAVAVSGITTLTTPWLIRAAEPAAAWIDRKLPRPLQTFVSLYAAWLERLRATAAERRSPGVGRFVRLLALDAAVLSALIIAVALQLDQAIVWLGDAVGLTDAVALTVVLVAAAVAATPLVIGIGRLARRLGQTLGDMALPRAQGKADLGAAPRRTLAVALQLGIVLVLSVVIVAITQLVLPSYAGPVVLAALLAGFAIALWRSAQDLESHVRAGAQAVIEGLRAYAQGGPAGGERKMADVDRLLPGLGAPVAVEVGADSAWVGKSLAELNLRGRTGATVLAISRGGDSIVVPPAGERLQAGDILALAGSHDAIEAAKADLGGLDARQQPVGST
jgi:CPA2 family monovalent cation:H+ antiporter-2